MNKDEKTTELLTLLENSTTYNEASKLDDRTYELDGRYVKFSDVSADKVFYGFVTTNVPHPKDDYDTQLEKMMDIYTSEQIVKGALKSIVIEQQASARKLATGDSKMSVAEFDSRFNALDVDTIKRLKTMEYIRQHIQAEYDKDQADGKTDGIRLF